MSVPFWRMALLFLGLLLPIGLLSTAVVATEKPIRQIEVTLGDGKQDSFMARLRRFSDAEGFAIRVVDYTPMGGKGIFVQMFRDDVKIYGTNPHDPRDFSMGIFENNKLPVTKENLDMLSSRLTTHIGDTGSVSVVK